jgi:hypothetical protein
MLEEMTGINRETVRKRVVKDLKKKKSVCACFVPYLLTPDQKHERTALSVEFVEMIDNDRNVLKTIETGDESWCFMYDPETKCQESSLVESKEIRKIRK